VRYPGSRGPSGRVARTMSQELPPVDVVLGEVPYVGLAFGYGFSLQPSRTTP
jgi:hypothetical protein